MIISGSKDLKIQRLAKCFDSRLSFCNHLEFRTLCYNSRLRDLMVSDENVCSEDSDCSAASDSSAMTVPNGSMEAYHLQESKAKETPSLVHFLSEIPCARVCQFFSRSKDCDDLGTDIPKNWRRILSNFCAARVRIGNCTYYTPEHAFHAEKAMCSSKPSMALNFIVGGTIGPLPRDAKHAGGRNYYKLNDAVLDRHLWFDKRTLVQQKIIEARLEQHLEFRSILKVVSHQNIQLVHYDRSGVRSYWGASVNARSGQVQGANRLGLLLMEAAARLSNSKTTTSLK